MGSLFVFFSKVASGFSIDSILDRILWILDIICSWFSQVVLYMKYGFYTCAIFLIFVKNSGPGDGHPLRTETPQKRLQIYRRRRRLGPKEGCGGFRVNTWIHTSKQWKKSNSLQSHPKNLAGKKKNNCIYTYLLASSTGVLKETLRVQVFAAPQTSSIQQV